MSTTRYFRSQVYAEGEILSEDEARERGTFIRARFDGGAVSRAEVVRGGTLREVIYYSPAGDAFEARHPVAFPGVARRRVMGLADRPGERISEFFDAEGRAVQRTVDEYDGQGEIVRSVRSRPDGRILDRVEYAYEGDELAVVREYDGDGELIDEEFLLD